MIIFVYTLVLFVLLNECDGTPSSCGGLCKKSLRKVKSIEDDPAQYDRQPITFACVSRIKYASCDKKEKNLEIIFFSL